MFTEAVEFSPQYISMMLTYLSNLLCIEYFTKKRKIYIRKMYKLESSMFIEIIMAIKLVKLNNKSKKINTKYRQNRVLYNEFDLKRSDIIL